MPENEGQGLTVEERISRLNEELNEEQKVAAEATDGPVIVIAGAGAGKTKTLIHRVGTLMLKGVPPTNIMVVTFTNKAAQEIKDRLGPMVGEEAEHITAGTFHSVIFRNMLQRYPESDYLQALGVDMDSCVILDESDAKSLLDSAISELSDIDREQMEDNKWNAASISGEMGIARSQGHDVNAFTQRIVAGHNDEELHRITAVVWRRYNQLCRDANGIDFDDILLHAARMLKREPNIAKELSETFKYLMLDEYQDTNPVQMAIMDAIAQHHNNIFVVGDEKQSIYRFRGSDVQVILSFRKRYADAKQVVMHRNYRSFPNIIKAANGCAQAMAQKLSDGNLTAMSQVPEAKKSNPLSNSVRMVQFDDEEDEAMAICDAINRDIARGVSGKDIAVLYRSRNSKRLLEKEIWDRGIPYYVIGDTAFFKRKEVKDAIALIRFIFHPWDSMAGLRTLRATSMGVSDDRAKRAMAEDGLGVSAFLRQQSDRRLKPTKKFPDGELSATARKVGPFVRACEQIKSAYEFGDSADYMKEVISALWDIYLLPGVERLAQKASNTDNENAAADAIDNVKNVIDRLRDELDAGNSIDEVIENLTLMSEHKPEQDQDMDSRVRMMTIHASKGLEFDNVYTVGCDDVNCPGETDDPEEIEESRRIMYVAATRAKEGLTMSCARFRTQYGNMIEAPPSRFLEEIAEATGTKIEELSPEEFAKPSGKYVAPEMAGLSSPS